MIIRKQKRTGVELHDVARTAVDRFTLQEAGYEILQLLAFSHDDDLVAPAGVFVGRSVKRYDKGVFQDLGTFGIGEVFETERGAASRERSVGPYYVAVVGGAFDSLLRGGPIVTSI